jgi:hypothetical protein
VAGGNQRQGAGQVYKEAGTVRLTLVEPLVVEVSADVAWSGRAFRHSVRILRVRPELRPDDVILPAQMEQED